MIALLEIFGSTPEPVRQRHLRFGMGETARPSVPQFLPSAPESSLESLYTSRTTSFGFLSSRKAIKREWRK